MQKHKIWVSIFLLYCLIVVNNVHAEHKLSAEAIKESSKGVLTRLLGSKTANTIQLEYINIEGNDTYEISAKNGKLTVKGNSPVAICHGFYSYYKNICHGIVRWSGSHLPRFEKWPEYQSGRVSSPYQFRNYLNVVTFGYTTPYWDWKRWQQEIDWMALHGFNFPLATVAAESIGERVWRKLGLTENDLTDFFTGPAYLPWHRMGNLNKWDGPLQKQWHQEQLRLQHKIIQQMRALGLHPVAPAFAGFVPRAFKDKHPEIAVKALKWGGFPQEYNAFVLPQRTEWFQRIGKMFVEEWEKEFGENTYYLSDSFNEMDVPVPEGHPEKKYELLADYGESIYKSIIAGNPHAVWVTQGWTFGYKHAFWNTASVHALVSKVPDDRMIILDLANEFPKYVWHIEPTWKTHQGYYGKKWIFSYVANFGGKIPLLGDMQMYATDAPTALHSAYSKNMIGFGMAPEGIENNEAVFELLSDIGWASSPINLDEWIETYCKASYGAYPEELKKAWKLMLKSNYGYFADYPRYLWQLVVPDTRRVGKVCDAPAFMEAVKLFLQASDKITNKPLFQNDAIEMAMLYLGIKANNAYIEARRLDSVGNNQAKKMYLDSTIKILEQTDQLLASHPLYSLQRWVNFARSHGETAQMKDKYEADAKRLITMWGGTVADYAAKLWSGLIRDYYIPRIKQYMENKQFDKAAWELKWVETPGVSKTTPYVSPLQKAKELINEYQ